jgi:hypothetical protein
VVKLGLSRKDNTEVAVKVVKKRKMTKEALEREVTSLHSYIVATSFSVSSHIFIFVLGSSVEVSFRQL